MCVCACVRLCVCASVCLCVFVSLCLCVFVFALVYLLCLAKGIPPHYKGLETDKKENLRPRLIDLSASMDPARFVCRPTRINITAIHFTPLQLRNRG